MAWWETMVCKHERWAANHKSLLDFRNLSGEDYRAENRIEEEAPQTTRRIHGNGIAAELLGNTATID